MNVEVKARASVFDDCQQNLGRGAPTLLAIHVLVVALGLPSPDCQGESNAAEPAPTFERDIAPLFQARCVKCHGPAKQEGSLDLSTAAGVERGGQSGAAIQAGGLIDNKIWARVSTGEMPPDEPLSDEERLILKAWISQSAADWPPIDRIQAAPLEHWSFRGPQPVIVPQVRNESACRNEIDRFLQAALESRGLGIGPEANRLTLLRRASFDLTGLPPTVDEIADYLVDSRDDAYERIVEHYLNSPRFGERWGKYWLDVAGYADSDGYFDYDAVRPLAFRYRDYVIRSINSDKPFDQFIREQLAGKLVDSRWSSKTVHRLIAGSAAYRQSSAFRADAYASDPDNRLLWRMPLKRLDAEQIYDAMLAASGELDLTAFGPATQIILRGNGEVAVADTLPGGRRRAVYLLQRRTQTPTMLRVFDAPSLVTNCVKRDSSTVPQQALTLLNSDSTRRRAANLARRVAMEAGSNNDERIARAFMLVFGHKPDGEETRSSLRFIRDQSRHYVNTNRTPQRGVWTDFCNSLFASNAFLYVD